MNHRHLVGALASLSLLVVALPAAAEAHEHHAHHAHHEAGAARLKLNQGKKWPTDEPLRQAMTTLQLRFAAQLHEVHAGKLGAAEYAALGNLIDSQISAIVSQCKLEPKADAMLHIVVGELAGAAETLQGKAAGKPAKAAQRAVKALNAYGKYFDHPQWQALE